MPLYYSRVPDRFSIIALALDPGKTVWFQRLPLYDHTSNPLSLSQDLGLESNSYRDTAPRVQHFSAFHSV